MKQNKVVHRLPKGAYLVSKRNRVFTDKKKEKESKACRGKINNETELEEENDDNKNQNT
jgi:hypothetical protein